MKIVFFFLLMLLYMDATHAAGGNKVGDGGFVVKCEGHPYEVLDLFEGRVAYNIKFDLYKTYDFLLETTHGSRMPTPAEFLQGAKRKIQEIVPEVSKEMDQVFRSFDSLDYYRDLGEVTGYGPLMVASSKWCQFRLAGVSVEEVQGRRVIYITKLAETVLKPEDLSALFLHEALRGWFHGKKGNLSLRQAVIYLMADDKFRILNKNSFRNLILTRQKQRLMPVKSYYF